MREIKFRAWDKKTKRLLHVFSMAFNIDPLGPVATVWCAEMMDEQADGFDIDDVDLMQFTGLWDKNGKEIYEGDVVRWSEPDMGTRVGEIVWEYREPYYGVILKTKDEILNGWHFKQEDSTLEVIGNIYENRELMKAG